MMRKQSLHANMSGSQVAGAPGSAPANMPVRSFSTSSALTDRTDEGEAVPLENPSDVSIFANCKDCKRSNIGVEGG